MRPDTTEWASVDHALQYLERQDQVPHRTEGEATLLEALPTEVHRVLDLGTGDGRLLALVLAARPEAEAVGVDMSPPMLEAARRRFEDDSRVEIVGHDLNDPLPDLGHFDAIVSSFAIHHCPDQRKRELYVECFARLTPGGAFLNLEHVASPTEHLQDQCLVAMDMTREDEDKSNILLDVWVQTKWLEQIGFEDVDCYWKWRELALFGGVRPALLGAENRRIAPLRGDRVRLRPARDADVAALVAIFSEPEVRPWWPGYDQARIERELLNNHDPDTTVYVIEVDGDVVGVIQSYEEPEPEYKAAWIDIAVGTDWHGTGVAVDALRTLARDLIDRRGHHHLFIDPAAANARAIACYKKVGFRPVGVMRQNERGGDGTFHDALLMDLLADELT